MPHSAVAGSRLPEEKTKLDTTHTNLVEAIVTYNRLRMPFVQTFIALKDARRVRLCCR